MVIACGHSVSTTSLGPQLTTTYYQNYYQILFFTAPQHFLYVAQIMKPQKKDPESLSKNPNTIKERKRRASKHGFDAELEKRKRANAEQIRLAKLKKKADPDFLKKTDSEQAQILEKTASDTKRVM